MRENNPEIKAQVIECLPNQLFRVQYGDKQYICYPSGNMKMNKIKILLGDWVRVMLDPYGGKATNRIVRRM